ncbi:FAD-dependent monooxygenase [Nonomuraea sp. NPDC052265]|uniref:FAD-dependent monooxygenase n=1 Tax=Nonomuraea sp. NPDC052265 TaxID=3364374 RepID=UPI0037CC61D3
MTDVIIVGGGPVGLLLACELKLGGAEPLVLEAATGEERVTRSLGLRSLNARTLHSLELRGLVEPLTEAQWRLFDELATGPGPDRSDLVGMMTELLRKGMMRGHFAGLPLLEEHGGAEYAMLKQHRIEAVLAARAAALGVPVRQGRAVVDVTQDAVRAVATLADGERVEAAYLVGCDGGRSLVRKRSGFAFSGTPATMTGRTAVATLTGPGSVTSSLRCPAGLVNLSLVPGEIATIEFGGGPGGGFSDGSGEGSADGSGDEPGGRSFDRDAPVTAEELAGSLRRVTGEDVGVARLEAGIRYSDNTRHADTYRRGRVLLAGDAAHVHSPIGGQGLNLGLQDAVNLGWKLALVARGAAPESLLDTYTDERHPVAARVLRNTRAQVAAMRPGAQVDALREVLSEVMALPDAKRHFTGMVEGTDVDYAPASPDPRVGRFTPPLTATPPASGPRAPGLHTSGPRVAGAVGGGGWGSETPAADGTGRPVAESLRDGRGLLLDLSGGADTAELAVALAGHRDRVRLAVAATPRAGGPEAGGPPSGARPAGGGALLIRPDGYVAWAGRPGSGLGDALAAWFGPAS